MELALIVYFNRPLSRYTSYSKEILEFVEQHIDPRVPVEVATVADAGGTEVEIYFANANMQVIDEVESALSRAGYLVDYA